jgi:hypothetical protein
VVYFTIEIGMIQEEGGIRAVFTQALNAEKEFV